MKIYKDGKLSGYISGGLVTASIFSDEDTPEVVAPLERLKELAKEMSLRDILFSKLSKEDKALCLQDEIACGEIYVTCIDGAYKRINPLDITK